jgi:hypothetical protein
MLWVLIAAVSNPLSNPYVPNRKLSTCSLWLQSWLKITNTAFDDLAIFIAPYIHVQSRDLGRRRSCAGSFSSTSTAFPRRQRARPATMPQLLFSRQSLWALLELKLTVPTLDPPWHITPCLTQIPLTSWLMGELQLAVFIQPPTTTNIRIKGFNGTYSAVRIGTVRWPILDDEGVRHVLQIPDTYFVASCPMRLLPPHHYSQQIHDHRGTPLEKQVQAENARPGR